MGQPLFVCKLYYLILFLVSSINAIAALNDNPFFCISIRRALISFPAIISSKITSSNSDLISERIFSSLFLSILTGSVLLSLLVSTFFGLDYSILGLSIFSNNETIFCNSLIISLSLSSLTDILTKVSNKAFNSVSPKM